MLGYREKAGKRLEAGRGGSAGCRFGVHWDMTFARFFTLR